MAAVARGRLEQAADERPRAGDEASVSVGSCRRRGWRWRRSRRCSRADDGEDQHGLSSRGSGRVGHAPVWSSSTRMRPCPGRRRRCCRGVVEEHRALGGDAELLEGQLVDARVGLAHAHRGGVDDDVEQLVERDHRPPAVGELADVVGEEAGAVAARPAAAMARSTMSVAAPPLAAHASRTSRTGRCRGPASAATALICSARGHRGRSRPARAGATGGRCPGRRDRTRRARRGRGRGPSPRARRGCP